MQEQEIEFDQPKTELTNSELNKSFKKARSLISAGQKERGLAQLDSLLIEAAAVHDTLAAFMLHKTAIVYQSNLGNPKKAVGLLKESIALREKHLQSAHPDLLNGYNLVGKYLRLQDDPSKLDSALLFVQESLSRNRTREKTTKHLGKSYWDLGKIYQILGDYETSKVAYTSAAFDMEQRGDMLGQSQVLNDLSTLYSLQLRQPDSALYYSRLAITTFEKLPEKTRISKSNVLANFYFDKAVALQMMGKYDVSLEVYDEAKEVYEVNENWVQIRRVWNNQSVCFNRLGQYEKAGLILEKAIRENQIAKNPSQLGKNFDNLGDTFRGLNQPDSAIHYYNESLRMAVVGFKPKSDFELPEFHDSTIANKDQVLTSLYSKAKTLAYLYEEGRGSKYLKAALGSYSYLDQLIDHLRLGLQSEISQNHLAIKARQIYEDAIKTCFVYLEATQENGMLETALQYAEKSKAIIQLGAMRNAIAKEIGTDKAGKDRLAKLGSKKEYFNTKLAWADLKQHSGPEVTSLRDSAVYYRLAYQNAITELESKNPTYFNLRYNTQTVSADYIQDNLLEPDQAMLEYFLGENSAYLFVITSKGKEMIELPVADYPKLVAEFREGLYGFYSDRNMGQHDQSYYIRKQQQAGWELYQALIAPAGPLPNRLIIVPDGHLGYVPFGSLITSGTDSQGRTQVRYLIQDHAIAYAPSATILDEVEKRKHDRHPSRKWVGFAPVFNQESNGDLVLTRSEVDALPNSEKEIELISELTGGDIFLREQATKAEFEKNADRYSVVHISTHGEINDGNPNFNYLRFWDSLLYAADIYSLDRLNAEMVVLSACNTGVGEVRTGEGIYNLARSFSFAGAASIVPTLWKVSNTMNTDFMIDFYNQLQNGVPKDLALQAVKKESIQKGGNPYYWAGYIAIGDPGSVQFKSSFPHWLYLLGGLGIVGTLYFLLQRKPLRSF